MMGILSRAWIAWLALAVPAMAQSWTPIPMSSRIDRVQPMTGIVLWADNEHNTTDAIQLEYSYMPYDAIVTGKNQYDWSSIERLLDDVKSRSHQAILRFYFVYPGKPTAVPAYIKQLADYKETNGKSEGKPTGFPDWSHPELQQCTLDFYSAFAQRYDKDARIAFLQTGFGLWAEYHIYDGPRKIGGTFPSKEYQATFMQHLSKTFVDTPWMISIDAADGDYSPLEQQPALLDLQFGVFDDSFLCKPHAKENAINWKFFGDRRYEKSPTGGEFSYYNQRDQKLALSKEGPNKIPFESMAAQFHVSFMIGSDQPEYQPMDRIRDAGIAIGYRFRLTSLQRNQSTIRAVVKNEGIAPCYYDAWLAVDGVRGSKSLKGVLPGESQSIEFTSTATSPKVTIQCDRLVPGQQIQLAADLK